MSEDTRENFFEPGLEVVFGRVDKPDGSVIVGVMPGFVRVFGSRSGFTPHELARATGMPLSWMRQFGREDNPDRWIDQCKDAVPVYISLEVATALAALIAPGRVLLLNPEQTKLRKQRLAGGAANDDAEVLALARKYLAKIPAAVSGCNGHAQTYAAATMMVHGFALSADAAFELLCNEYNPRCSPPWTERELRRKVEDATKRFHDKPSGWIVDRIRGGR